MITFTTKEIPIDKELESRTLFFCKFCSTTPQIINRKVRHIDKTNINYIEQNKIIIKDITFLAFNYSKEIYIGNLMNKIKLNELEKYTKNL